MLNQRKIVPQMVEDYNEFIETLIIKDNKNQFDDNSNDNDNDCNDNDSNKNKINSSKDLIISNSNENTKLSALLKTIEDNKCSNKLIDNQSSVNQSSIQCNDKNANNKKKRIIIIKKGKKTSDCDVDKNKCGHQDVIVEKIKESTEISEVKVADVSDNELNCKQKDNDEDINNNNNNNKDHYRDKEIDVDKGNDKVDKEKENPEVETRENNNLVEIKDESKDENKYNEIKNELIEEKRENVEIVLNPILQTLMYNRSHHFVTKTIIPKEMCDICGESFNFSEKYINCIDCLSICHLNCNSKIPLPCIPYTIPNKFKSKCNKEIVDYVYPGFKPSIPLILIRCCHEIETRCQISRTDDLYLMNSEGLKQVKDLCDRIMKKKNNILMLDSYNINFVCGVVKKFLNDLNEPLFSKELWKQFSLNARKKTDDEVKSYVKQLVMELRTSNRDTISFMILHLQNIAENQKYLSLINLAEIFCPIVCGDTEVSRKLRLMTTLLDIECEFWLKIIFKNMF